MPISLEEFNENLCCAVEEGLHIASTPRAKPILFTPEQIEGFEDRYLIDWSLNKRDYSYINLNLPHTINPKEVGLSYGVGNDIPLSGKVKILLFAAKEYIRGKLCL